MRKLAVFVAGVLLFGGAWTSVAMGEDGKALYTKSCVSCHGAAGKGGEGPALNNKVLLAAATDTYLVETISRGRRNTAMQGFLKPSIIWPALTRAEIESIVAYIRSWEGKKS